MHAFRFAARLTAAVMAISTPAAALAQTCSYGTGAALSIALVPQAPGPNLMTTPFYAQVAVGGGGAHQVLVDTGSPAIAMALSKIGSNYTVLSQNQTYGYVSSGNYFMGDWVLANVSVTLAGGGSATTTAPIPVFGATQYCENKDNCQPLSDKQVATFGMLGVGFKPFTVPGLAAGVTVPNTNLFMNLPVETQGYVITANSIQVGLNQANTANFKTLPAPNATPPQTCISYTAANGQTGPFCGATLLMDTGINHFYLTMPQGYCPANGDSQGVAPNGTTVTLSAPSTQDPILNFTFTVGGTGNPPMTPSYVNCVTETGGTVPPPPSAFHVNTGRMVVAGMDYMYNPQCGVVGFRPTTAQ